MDKLQAWQDLVAHSKQVQGLHIKDLLKDEDRVNAFAKEHNGLFVDFSRQLATKETLAKLIALAKASGLEEKKKAMFSGAHINATEDRAVLHVALRSAHSDVYKDGGVDQVPLVHAVLDKIKAFSEAVRSGQWVGITGKPLTDVVAIGIGGSFLGPLFVHTALRTGHDTALAANGRRLRFLANVDPIDVAKALNGLHPENTLVVIVSKTFTTAETMLNARTVRAWLTKSLGDAAVAKHMVAVSTNQKLVEAFGIDVANMFGFWDWVGGRYSVSSAVGMLPLALQYGFDVIQSFLEGMRDVDVHFRDAPLEENIPVLVGLLGVWNATFLGHPTRAILPYCQALAHLAPHIQQLSMESNGKGVDMEGRPLAYPAGEIEFGEPGTNGQHSFYQLIHQGRIIPCDFVGVVKSQQPVYLEGEVVSNHDELMSNFFAQADALAYGKTPEELRAEGVPEKLVAHKTFSGNRPSTSILLPHLDAFSVGQLLAHYEHRIAVQGWVWGINSFDQWGVELGKALAGNVRKQINGWRTKQQALSGFNLSTANMMKRYLQGKTQNVAGGGSMISPDILPMNDTPSAEFLN